MELLERHFESFFQNDVHTQKNIWKGIKHLYKNTLNHRSFARNRLLLALCMLTGGTTREKRYALDVISDVMVEAKNAPDTVWESSMFVRISIEKLDQDKLFKYPCIRGEVVQLAYIIDKMWGMCSDETFDFGGNMMKRRMLCGGDIGCMSCLPPDIVHTIAEKI